MNAQLAQLNVGRLVAPIDDPAVQAFADALDPINEAAERSPGFVWRLQTDEGNATGIEVSDDPLLIANLSVWTSLEALADYVYRSAHTEYLRRRREWFSTLDEAAVVLWWVPAGHVPTVEEAMDRLEQLRRLGPTPTAFTFRQPYDADAAAGPVDPRDVCPA